MLDHAFICCFSLHADVDVLRVLHLNLTLAVSLRLALVRNIASKTWAFQSHQRDTREERDRRTDSGALLCPLQQRLCSL